MFRIVVSNSNDDHPHAAPFQWGQVFTSKDEAEASIPRARDEYPSKDGYRYTVEVLDRKFTQAGDPKSAEWKEA